MNGQVPRVGGGSAGAAVADHAPFPKMKARSLTGRSYDLPGDFEGDPSVVLVGFEPWHQGIIDSWVPTLEGLAARGPGTRIYELVPIPRSSLLARPFIDGGMVAGIPSREVRARTLTSYTNLPRALAGLGLPDSREAALFLIDGHGRIRWRAVGGLDPGRAEELARILAPGALASPRATQASKTAPTRILLRRPGLSYKTGGRIS